MKTLLFLCVLMSGCATIDKVFGPPFDKMTPDQRLGYCVQWPTDNACAIYEKK